MSYSLRQLPQCEVINIEKGKGMTGPKTKMVAGMNGLGRFGLNLLWQWMSDPGAPYTIGFMNDEVLTPGEIYRSIIADPILTGFEGYEIKLRGNVLVVQRKGKVIGRIIITTGSADCADWLGKPDLFLECSGRRHDSSLCEPFLIENTRTVIISATSLNADGTFLAGFNHEEFRADAHRIISYGSCTVNPGVVLSTFVDEAFGIEECLVNVIHGVPQWQLNAGLRRTLRRNECTLEVMGPKFVPALRQDNFKVNYTYVPWVGPSIIDFAFRVRTAPTRKQAVAALRSAIKPSGKLAGLIGMIPKDTGPETHFRSHFSAVIIESDVEMRGDTLHLFCYFNNEGSASRFHDLTCHVTRQLAK